MTKIYMKKFITCLIALAMVASLVVMPAGAREVSQEIFTADYAHSDGLSAFTDSGGDQSLELKTDGLYLTATGFNSSTDIQTYAGMPFDGVCNDLDIQLKWKKGVVKDSTGATVGDIAVSNIFYLGLKSDTSNSYQSIIGMDSNGSLNRISGNPATAYQSPAQPKLSGGYYNMQIKFYKEGDSWYACFYDLNDSGKQFFYETFNQFTNGATGIGFGITRMGSEMQTGREWTAAISELTVKNGGNVLYQSSLKKNTVIDTINIREGEFDLSQSDEGVTLTTTDYSSSTSKKELMGVNLGADYENLEAIFKWKKGSITDADGNVLSTLDRTVSSTYVMSLLASNGEYIPILDMDYTGKLVRHPGNPVTMYQNPGEAVIDDGFYNLKLKFSKNKNDGYWYAYFYDMNNSEAEIYSEKFEGFENGAKGITFGVSRMGSEVTEGTIWKTTLRSLTVNNSYEIVKDPVSDVFFSSDFAYPDCREDFANKNGTMTFESKNDGLHLVASGFNYSTDGTTYAGVPFDNVYDNLDIRLSWKGEVKDQSGNLVTNVSTENKFFFGLKNDTSGGYTPIIGASCTGGFFRIGGNPATAYANATQPVMRDGYYNIQIKFSKNEETGYWWAYFYDLNYDGKQFFSERFNQFTNGASGFGFGVIRMGSEVSTKHVWSQVMKDLSITTDGGTKVYSSPLTDTHSLDTINIKEGTFGITQDKDGVTLTTTDYSSGSKKEMMGFNLGTTYSDIETSFRWKKGYITDSSGNVLKNLDRNVSSTYTVNLLSDDGNYIPLIAMSYMGDLTRPAGNAVTLYQTPQAAVTDADGFYNLKFKFGKNASDGYWYSYFYDMNNSGKEIYRERYEGFTNGTNGITFGVSRVSSEVTQGTVWRNTLKNITIKTSSLPRNEVISDVRFTDGSGNPITIGYGADEINVSLTVSKEIYGSYNLYIYLTGYNDQELKTIQRIPVEITEGNAGDVLTYTFDPCDYDMVKKVFLFDTKLMPFFDEVPSLYLINSEENGENVKYVYANTAVNVAELDYDNIRVCNADGDVCAETLDVFYYPEDELVMIEVKASENCPENVKVYGLEGGAVDGTAFQGYSETTYGTYIKGIRYDKNNQTIYVQVINSSNDSQTKHITVFRRALDGSLEEIAVKEVGIDANSNNKLAIPYSEDILGGFYAILQ